MTEIYQFTEDNLTIRGDQQILRSFVEDVRRLMHESGSDVSNALGDLVYQIESHFGWVEEIGY